MLFLTLCVRLFYCIFSVALKERVIELEAEIAKEREEVSRMRKSAAKSDNLQDSLQKKDAVLRATREQVHKLTADITQYRTDADDRENALQKKIRHLQRQLDVMRQQKEQAERELELILNRTAGRAGDSANLSVSEEGILNFPRHLPPVTAPAPSRQVSTIEPTEPPRTTIASAVQKDRSDSPGSILTADEWQTQTMPLAPPLPPHAPLSQPSQQPVRSQPSHRSSVSVASVGSSSSATSRNRPLSGAVGTRSVSTGSVSRRASAYSSASSPRATTTSSGTGTQETTRVANSTTLSGIRVAAADNAKSRGPSEDMVNISSFLMQIYL